MRRRTLFGYLAAVLLVAMPIVGFAFKGSPHVEFPFAHYNGSTYQWFRAKPYEIEIQCTHGLPKPEFFAKAQEACRKAGFKEEPGEFPANLERPSGLEIVKLECAGSEGQIEYIHPVTGLKSVWVSAFLRVFGDPAQGDLQD